MEPHGNVIWQPLTGTAKRSNMHFAAPWPETTQTFIDAPDGGRWHVSLTKTETHTEWGKIVEVVYEGLVTHVGVKFVLTVLND